MKKPVFSELYFSGSSRGKPKTLLPKPHRRPFENFDIEKESLRLYAFAESPGHRASVSGVKLPGQSGLKTEESLSSARLAERRINVFRDQGGVVTSPSPLWREEGRRLFTPRVESREGRRRNGGNWSLSLQRGTPLTSDSNQRFRENMKAINRREELLSDEPEVPELRLPKQRKKPEAKDFGFITQRTDESLLGESDEPVTLKADTDARVAVKKYAFLYFCVATRNRESPLKAKFTVVDGEKASRFKIYVSSKNRSPNKFNADLEIEVLRLPPFLFLYLLSRAAASATPIPRKSLSSPSPSSFSRPIPPPTSQSWSASPSAATNRGCLRSPGPTPP